MLGILRFFAVCTMLLALLMGLIQVPTIFEALTAKQIALENKNSSAAKTTSTTEDEAPGLWQQLAPGTRLRSVTGHLQSPALLFCTGGMLFVLIRIARSQE
jgi:hypothetical protein